MFKSLVALFCGLLLTVPAYAVPHKHAAPVAASPAPASPSGNYGPNGLAAPETNARNAYLVDYDTGRVLYDKNGEERMPTSSMSKMMTIYLVFDQLKQGHLHLDDKLPVSEHAWRVGGAGSDSSTMFLKLGDTVRVEDLIRGVIIQSGNDATIVLAEGIAGSEDAFAERMNIKAQELGMSQSHFMNASGIPDPEHYSTAKDLSILARRLIIDFPEYYHYFSEREFTWNGIKQGNRNPLLYKNIGVDGLKTGHAEAAGYGLTASGIENDHRLILVVNGLPSMQARADEPTTLLEWGWHEFRLLTLFKQGQVLDQVPVWLGTAPTVAVAADADVKLTLTNEERRGLKAELVYDQPIPAPVKAGQKVGVVKISVPNQDPIEIPLVATTDVPRLGATARIFVALRTIL